MAWEVIDVTAAAPLTVNIEAFEGPLDLLLHLIKKNKIDIADIPIALITRQYLEYLELMRSLDISVAGEYLEMAATLLFIKSRMLLPSADAAEAETGDEAQEDPRELLKAPLEALLEIKGLAAWLSERPLLGRDVFTKDQEPPTPGAFQEVSIGDITLYDLLVTYVGVLDRKKKKLPLVLERREFRIEEEIERIRERLGASHQVSFFDLLRGNDRTHIITLFMAVLELAKEGSIRLVQRDDGELIIFNSAASNHQGPRAQAQM